MPGMQKGGAMTREQKATCARCGLTVYTGTDPDGRAVALSRLAPSYVRKGEWIMIDHIQICRGRVTVLREKRPST